MSNSADSSSNNRSCKVNVCNHVFLSGITVSKQKLAKFSSLTCVQHFASTGIIWQLLVRLLAIICRAYGVSKEMSTEWLGLLTHSLLLGIDRFQNLWENNIPLTDPSPKYLHTMQSLVVYVCFVTYVSEIMQKRLSSDRKGFLPSLSPCQPYFSLNWAWKLKKKSSSK